jgi:hypothetical protein
MENFVSPCGYYHIRWYGGYMFNVFYTNRITNKVIEVDCFNVCKDDTTLKEAKKHAEDWFKNNIK